MEELLSALVASILMGSFFVCITVVVYHKISCTNRLKMHEVDVRFPVAVSDIQKLLSDVLPILEDEHEWETAKRVNNALKILGGSR